MDSFCGVELAEGVAASGEGDAMLDWNEVSMAEAPVELGERTELDVCKANVSEVQRSCLGMIGAHVFLGDGEGAGGAVFGGGQVGAPDLLLVDLGRARPRRCLVLLLDCGPEVGQGVTLVVGCDDHTLDEELVAALGPRRGVLLHRLQENWQARQHRSASSILSTV